MLLCAWRPAGSHLMRSPFCALTTMKPLFVPRYHQPVGAKIRFPSGETHARSTPAGARIINRVVLRVAAKSAQTFLKRNINAPDQPMAVVDIEDENSLARATRLRSVGRAQVEVAFEARVRAG